MNIKTLCLAVVAGLFAACGASSDDTAEAPASAALDGAQSGLSDQGGGFLHGAPDPCVLLTEDVAKEILGGDRISGLPGNGGFGSSGGRCLYRGAGDQFISALIDFHSKSVFDSEAMSAAEMVDKADALYWQGNGGERAQSDLGMHSFVFSNGNRTALVILTGIGGTATLSDRIVSEVVLCYSIENKTQNAEARLATLTALAKVQLPALYELANTTHGDK